MLREATRRTAVAIALMGVLLLSVGTCVLPAQAATHGCCMHMTMPCEPGANCCVAAPHTPPAMVTPAFHGVAAVEAVRGVVAAGDGAISRDVAAAVVLPAQASPPGNFILRI